MFNPDPRIERVQILPGQDCLVIDDALLEPERLLSWRQRIERDPRIHKELIACVHF